LTARLALWSMVLAMFVANGAFDIGIAHVAYRLAEKAAGQNKWGDSTFYPWEGSFGASIHHPNERLPVIARHILEARYALTALPLLLILYFTWTCVRVSEAQLGLAVSLGAFSLAAKVHCWEMLRRVTDLYTSF